jgi:hypothetical protein
VSLSPSTLMMLAGTWLSQASPLQPCTLRCCCAAGGVKAAAVPGDWPAGWLGKGAADSDCVGRLPLLIGRLSPEEGPHAKVSEALSRFVASRARRSGPGSAAQPKPQQRWRGKAAEAAVVAALDVHLCWQRIADAVLAAPPTALTGVALVDLASLPLQYLTGQSWAAVVPPALNRPKLSDPAASSHSHRRAMAAHEASEAWQRLLAALATAGRGVLLRGQGTPMPLSGPGGGPVPTRSDSTAPEITPWFLLMPEESSRGGDSSDSTATLPLQGLIYRITARDTMCGAAMGSALGLHSLPQNSHGGGDENVTACMGHAFSGTDFLPATRFQQQTPRTGAASIGDVDIVVGDASLTPSAAVAAIMSALPTAAPLCPLDLSAGVQQGHIALVCQPPLAAAFACALYAAGLHELLQPNQVAPRPRKSRAKANPNTPATSSGASVGVAHGSGAADGDPSRPASEYDDDDEGDEVEAPRLAENSAQNACDDADDDDGPSVSSSFAGVVATPRAATTALQRQRPPPPPPVPPAAAAVLAQMRSRRAAKSSSEGGRSNATVGGGKSPSPGPGLLPTHGMARAPSPAPAALGPGVPWPATRRRLQRPIPQPPTGSGDGRSAGLDASRSSRSPHRSVRFESTAHKPPTMASATSREGPHDFSNNTSSGGRFKPCTVITLDDSDESDAEMVSAALLVEHNLSRAGMLPRPAAPNIARGRSSLEASAVAGLHAPEQGLDSSPVTLGMLDEDVPADLLDGLELSDLLALAATAGVEGGGLDGVISGSSEESSKMQDEDSGLAQLQARVAQSPQQFGASEAAWSEAVHKRRAELQRAAKEGGAVRRVVVDSAIAGLLGPFGRQDSDAAYGPALPDRPAHVDAPASVEHVGAVGIAPTLLACDVLDTNDFEF